MVETTQLWDHAEPFSIVVRAQEDDIDGFGHVNNVVYLRWLTECAWAHSAHVGLPEETCVALRRGMAVRAIHLDLLASAYLHEELHVRNWITTFTGLRASRIYQIVNPDKGITVLRGHVDFVCVNLDNGRPARMPKEFLERYGSAVREDVLNP